MPEFLPPFFEQTLFGNTLWQWSLAALITIGTLLLIYLLRNFIEGRLRALAKQSNTKVDDLVADVISRTSALLVLLVALKIGTQALMLPDQVDNALTVAALFAGALQVGTWLNPVLRFLIRAYVTRDGDDEGDKAAAATLSFLGQLVLWSLLLLVTIDNIPGVQLTTLITGLGIGGIAVALAVQNILGDLFASLSILIDEPFKVGHFIVVGDFAGTVTRIGLKSTRIRALTGEEVVFSNTDLLNSRIQNFKRMMERRVLFRIGVLYETDFEKLQKVPQIIEDAITAEDQARFERAHLFSFGDSALVYEVVYHVVTGDYDVYMDVQQSINLFLVRRFRELGIEFAYPTQMLYLDGKITGPNGTGEPETQLIEAQGQAEPQSD